MLWRALKHIPQGFWIDVGAAHPDEYSVTRAFSDHGWRGINIEANPPYVARIAGARPRDVTLAVAAGASAGKVPFFEVVGTGMSTMDRVIAEQHRLAGYEIREHEVPSRTLASICAEYAPADIHFLKIDVEGAERDVLAGADFTNHRPWIVLVEATKPNSQEQNHAIWEPLLLAANYRFVWFDGLNRFYIAAELWDELAPSFAAPPNIFDDFIRATDAEHLNRIVGAERRAGEAEARAGQTVALADRRVTEAEARATQAETRAAEAEAEIAQAQARSVEAEARMTEAQARAADAETRRAQAETRAAIHAGEIKARLAQLHASTSWRLTGPIRAARELMRGRAGLALQEMGMAPPTVERLKNLAGKLSLLKSVERDVFSKRAGRPASRSVSRHRKVGWVTTWNVKCGIAAAAAHLIDGLPQENVVVYAAHQEPRTRPDAENCRRIWSLGKGVNGLSAILDDLEQAEVGALVIHFNYGFYNHTELAAFIEEAVARGIVVIMELHSTVDHSKDDPNLQLASLISGLRKCHRLLAHAPADVARLEAMGLIDNVTLFPLGVIAGADRPARARQSRDGTLIASFGFCLPGKGLPELVEAIGILVKQGVSMRLLMLNAQYPASVSEDEVEKVRRTIHQFDLEGLVDLRTDYLSDEQCLLLLQEADLIVNSYQATGEAASAAARFSLASGSPLLVTPIPIFDELGDAVFRMPGVSPGDIAKGIAETLGHLEHDTQQCRSVRSAALEWRNAHDFKNQGAILMGMIEAIRRDPGRWHA
ncbi:hypothetical protein MesoLj113b_50780 [Mesorhizobium sp. 113-3-3]|nr:hypothetical protein MesoLj113b_50780 [Mesorhizobium sp. 113-3-3]